MSKPGRSRVIRLAEAQAGIPGPAVERAVMDVALGLPLRSSQQTPHSKRDRFQSGDLLFVAARTSISSRTLPRTSPYGVYFTPLMVATSQIERGAGQECKLRHYRNLNKVAVKRCFCNKLLRKATTLARFTFGRDPGVLWFCFFATD